MASIKFWCLLARAALHTVCDAHGESNGSKNVSAIKKVVPIKSFSIVRKQ